MYLYIHIHRYIQRKEHTVIHLNFEPTAKSSYTLNNRNKPTDLPIPFVNNPDNMSLTVNGLAD